jgi:hypothetical protein
MENYLQKHSDKLMESLMVSMKIAGTPLKMKPSRITSHRMIWLPVTEQTGFAKSAWF